MFVPHARVHITGVRSRRVLKARRLQSARRKLGLREILRMPCLVPTAFVVFFGVLILAGGAGMSVLGYIPETITGISDDGNTTTITMVTRDARYFTMKSLSYVGPILMGFGFFAIIVSCVLYCEIMDRYAVLMPSKPDTKLKRQALMDMILGEFKKSYFRGIEVPLRKEEPQSQAKGNEREKETLLKAISLSTPVLLMSPDLAPTWRFSHYAYKYPGRRYHHALKPRHPKLKQLGGSGSSGHEPWLKTSSMPNICDPDISRGHGLPQHVPLDHSEAGVKVRRVKRFGKPSRSMENRISLSLPQTLTRSSTGVDNPAYLHEQARKKSVSMCVHSPIADPLAISYRPHNSRFLKASQMQPRVRIQQQQQNQIQLQQQLQQRHQDAQDAVDHQRHRCDSDSSKPVRRPKLVRTKGTHKSCETSDRSFDELMPPDPPPFPAPAHFMSKRQDTLYVASPRTAKLLRARCKSEDVRDKRKPDMLFLKDLFRSVDIRDPQPSTQSSATLNGSATLHSSTTMQIAATVQSAVVSSFNEDQALHFVDPLAGQKCEIVDIKSVSSGRRKGTNTRENFHHASLSLDILETEKTNSNSGEPCYQLPLLSGVLRPQNQWEIIRRDVNVSSSNKEKSHSPDSKDKVQGSDSKRTEGQSLHGSKLHYDHKQQQRNAGLLKPPLEKDISNKLRSVESSDCRGRPKSWDGNKAQSLDTPTSGTGKASSLAAPRLDRASSFEPLTTRGFSLGPAFMGHVRKESPHCNVKIVSETKKGKSQSDEIPRRTPLPQVSHLALPHLQHIRSKSADNAASDKRHTSHGQTLKPPPSPQHFQQFPIPQTQHADKQVNQSLHEPSPLHVFPTLLRDTKGNPNTQFQQSLELRKQVPRDQSYQSGLSSQQAAHQHQQRKQLQQFQQHCQQQQQQSLHQQQLKRQPHPQHPLGTPSPTSSSYNPVPLLLTPDYTSHITTPSPSASPRLDNAHMTISPSVSVSPRLDNTHTTILPSVSLAREASAGTKLCSSSAVRGDLNRCETVSKERMLSKSNAIEESSPENEDTEITPLI